MSEVDAGFPVNYEQTEVQITDNFNEGRKDGCYKHNTRILVMYGVI